MRLVLIALLLVACSQERDRPTGSARDASAHPDASGVDTGVADAGTVQSLDECFQGQSPTPGSFNMIQTLENATENITIRLAVEPGSRPAVGETFPYDLVRFAVDHQGTITCITDMTLLFYQFGHHNWDESGEAQHRDTTYQFSMVIDMINSAWTDTLTVKRISTGETILGPLTMSDGGCRSIPPGDLNTCFHRTRID